MKIFLVRVQQQSAVLFMGPTCGFMLAGTVVRTRAICSIFSIGASSFVGLSSLKTAAQRPRTPCGLNNC